MKKVIILVIVSIVLFGPFQSCKKGPDDPAISFRTRKARLVGDWRLQKGNAAVTQLNVGGAPSIDQGFVLDGSYATVNETPTGGALITYKFGYSLNLKINKDGSFKLSENYGGSLLSATGTWDFLKGVGADKSKEDVIFQIRSVDSDETDGHLFNLQGTSFTYKLLELKNKEIKLETGNSSYINANGAKFGYSATYQLIQ